MKKNAKKRKRRRQHVQTLRADNDLHIAFGDGPIDPTAWARSIDTVAKADREWLTDHPDADCRRRAITPVEMQMTGYGPDVEVVISRGPDACQVRTFLLPN